MAEKGFKANTVLPVASYGLLLSVYCLFDVLGLVADSGPFLDILVIAAFLLMMAVMAFRRKIEERIKPYHAYLKPPACVLLVLVAFFLLELPYNSALAEMPSSFVVINLCIVAVLFYVVYFMGQQTRAAAFLFLAACFLIGLANYFVVSFKGQPIVPADLFALQTAAAVSAGYTYTINAYVAGAYVLFAFGALVIAFLPKPRLKPGFVMANTGGALIGILAFSSWFAAYDIESEYECTVDVWSTQESYSRQGSTLCFLKRIQDIKPSAPDGYSPERVDELLGTGAKTTGIAGAHAFNGIIDANGADDLSEMPTVVVIMNESFADLSEYPILSGLYGGPAYYHSLTENVRKGTAYVSALGGGTCNSEFEFLTGCSLGHLGGGVYPYVLYDLDATENLAAYFNALGYKTCAIHPAESVNWRRNVIYGQLGFDEFVDISAFSDAQTLREKPTDKETYEKVLDRLKEDDAPQFIFDITLQNHGGYTTGLMPEDLQVRVPLGDDIDPELAEYLGCIQQSDQDLEYLIEGLKSLDRKVVLCFFGDHQPEFVDRLAELEFGKSVSELDLAEVQARYSVPYMIWKNYDSEGQDEGSGGDTSLNYLGALLVREAGLPLTNYQHFLLGVRDQMPAINLNGYLDTVGVWHWIGEESAVLDIYHAYALVQYDNLFTYRP